MKYLGKITDNKDLVTKEYVDHADNTKQNTLVSGTNIKTINNESLLGSGNITIQGGDGGHVELTQAEYDALPQATKENGDVYFITDGSPIPTPLYDVFVNKTTPMLDLSGYSTAGTTDKAIYDAVVALGWDSDVLIN